jgi:O-antigen ligase
VIRTRTTRHIGAVAIAAGAAAELVALVAAMRFGPAALLLPTAAAAALVLLQRPAWAVGVVVGLAVLVEQTGGGALASLSPVYTPLPGGPSAMDLLLGLAVAAVALDALRERRGPRLPATLLPGLGLFAIASLAGALAGTFAGETAKDVFYAGRQLPYIIAVPVLVFAVVRTRRELISAVTALVALAVVKAVLGLLALGAGGGLVVDGTTITYYEPAANGLMLLVILVVAAAMLLRARPPAWLLAATPLLLLSLALSFRRSFWIGAVLGLALVCVLGAAPSIRRLAVPVAIVLAAGAWALSSVGFQAQGPIVARAQSLQPSKVQANAQDRYRIDERRNVVEELRRHPVTGLGLGVPWRATHPLSVEHESDRGYVHGVVLWDWLKLGIVGVLAYACLLAAGVRLGWRLWRRSADPLLRALGLGALSWLLAMAVVETTASFTGVDLRYSVLAGVVLGLLAVGSRLPARVP